MNLAGLRNHIGLRRVMLFTLVVTAALAAAVYTKRGAWTQQLARRWQAELDHASPEEVTLLLHQLSCLGNTGIPSLVAAMGSQRESVARAGKDELWDEFQRWKSLDVGDYEPKVTCLARALAEQVEQFGPTARCDAAELAVRILREFPAAARGPVVDACEEVLRVTAPQRRLSAAHDGAGSPDRLAGEIPGDRPSDVTTAGLAAASPLWARPIAPPGLPVSMPSVASDGVAFEPGVALAGEGERASRGGSPLAEGSGTGQGRPGPGGNAASSSDDPQTASVGPIDGQPGTGRQVSTDGGRLQSQSSKYNGLQTVDLMRQLHMGNAKDVEQELRWRGFNDVQLEMARQLFDPDPRVRKALAELLPSLQSVDAVPWLMQLCRDEDAEVRMTAVALMATTRDPALKAEAERIARQDGDPRLKDQAERIARQGQKTLR